MTTPAPQPIVMDCDTGIDDAIAIMYAVLSPAVELLAVGAVWGNTTVKNATRNTLHVLDLVGATEVPVAAGAASPLAGGQAVFAPHVHGGDGQGGMAPETAAREAAPHSAAQQLVETIRARPGEVEIVAVGPLTNVAMALLLEPDLPRLAKGLTIMGGAALAPGNVTPMAEANILCDPEAAHAAFAAEWPLTIVPLDVTMLVHLTETHRTRLAAAGPAAQYIAGALETYFSFFASENYDERQSPMHDVLAVAIAAGQLVPTLAPTVTATVDISQGPSRGKTICDLRGIYRNYPPIEGARATVVLEVPDGFADEVVAMLSAAGDGGGAAGAAAGGVA
ncbi:nucleoside hydrolase [Euzebya tangerina]|uniref:nucleoside hydrolase n=1 Tax=Euzebya tangerina TaxID=591198 RepID=UPI000E318D8E|nr:nucleoside hydrolase [Euzebya tangerina]